MTTSPWATAYQTLLLKNCSRPKGSITMDEFLAETGFAASAGRLKMKALVDHHLALRLPGSITDGKGNFWRTNYYKLTGRSTPKVKVGRTKYATTRPRGRPRNSVAAKKIRKCRRSM